MKKIYYTLIIITAISFAAHAQQKDMNTKKKFNFMQHFHPTQSSTVFNQNLSLKINPYWEAVYAPHLYNSYNPQIKVPCYNAVWAKVNVDPPGDTKYFLRTADGGRNWRHDTIQSPDGYAIGTISAIDANTCYASMYNQTTNLGGGIFKTTNGGATWKQLAAGKIFDSTSFPDFVYFFDAKNGLAVGDNNGDTSRLEMYTTSDAGATWVRVPKTGLPPTAGSAYSFSFNVYATFENRFWFRGYDSQGNNYIYRSDDLGHHWKLFPYTLPTPIYAYAFADKLNGLGVSFDNNGPYEVATHDGGATWADKTFTGYPMGGFITVIPGTHTFVSTLPAFTPVYGSSYSNDYGATWKLIDTGQNALHTSVEFINPLVGWTGSTSAPPSGGLYKWKLDFSFICNSFLANKTENNVLLNWNVENNWNSNDYSVERSADGVNFSEINKVKSIVNAGQTQLYNYEDNSALSGTQYYRLKQVGIVGNTSYSTITKVDLGNSQLLQLYPNPAKDAVTVQGLNTSAKTTLSLFSLSGKLVQQSGTSDKSYTFYLQKLASGSYYIKAESGKQAITLKFIKQ